MSDVVGRGAPQDGSHMKRSLCVHATSILEANEDEEEGEGRRSLAELTR